MNNTASVWMSFLDTRSHISWDKTMFCIRSRQEFIIDINLSHKSWKQSSSHLPNYLSIYRTTIEWCYCYNWYAYQCDATATKIISKIYIYIGNNKIIFSFSMMWLNQKFITRNDRRRHSSLYFSILYAYVILFQIFNLSIFYLVRVLVVDHSIIIIKKKKIIRIMEYVDMNQNVLLYNASC